MVNMYISISIFMLFLESQIILVTPYLVPWETKPSKTRSTLKGKIETKIKMEREAFQYV